jgi:hypothetical protein
VARNLQRGAASPGPSLLLTGRRMLATLGCALIAAVAAGIVVLHGGGNGTAEAARVAAPSCASAERGVAPPPEIPAAVLPPGTVVTSVRRPRAGTTIVTGTLASPFRSAVEFFVVKLPAAGYLNTTGDAEMDEAESFFRGASVRGKWKVNGILGCADAVRLALLVTT